MLFEVAGITLPVWLPVLWGVLVGLVFSTVGAAGGILASVGLISVMGNQEIRTWSNRWPSPTLQTDPMSH